MLSKEQVHEAKTRLEERGWVHVRSVSAPERGAGKNEYGLLFERNGERFWFNKDSFFNQPTG